MPKLKTHSGAKKRFKVTANGKVVGKKAGRSHNLSHKSRSRSRRLKAGLVLTPVEAAKMKTLLPTM